MRFNPALDTIEKSFEKTEPQLAGYIVGVDIGKQRDWTAINVLARSVGWIKCMEKARFEPVPLEGDRKRFITHGIVHIEKPALGTPYPTVARRVCALLDELPPAPEPPVLVVDATGVGQPIVDMFRGVGLRPVALTITGGKQVVRHSSHVISVPKATLAENIKVLIQDGRLRVASELARAANLRMELAAFGQKISETGHESFEGIAEHDDIVLSIALSAWVSEHKPEPIRGLDINIFDR